jgi:hypothetical protein
LKLPQLLAHFLYQNKTLALAGIGVFTMDPSTIIPEETEKEHPLIVQGVHFDNAPILKPDPSLIEFIHKYTGKMKPLAESDLDSYLRLGIQLLNIGKPFYLEGIGSITKNKDNKYEFEAGEYSFLRLNMPGEEKAEAAEKRKKQFEDQQIDYAPQSKTARKILLAIGVVGGIALIGWGGYNLYKNKTITKGENEKSSVVTQEDTAEQLKNDTLYKASPPSDSVAAKKKDSSILVSKRTDSSLYKFVILTTQNKNRALRRYKQLDSISPAVKIVTRDSSIFKIYFVIHTSPKDTLHIKDSLNSFYATKTTIEQ